MGDKADSYLGYIVCRVGDAPLVGRALIAVPDYINECHTAIVEPVHLLGQRLVVRGVPFMQQDSRYGVCAHVAAWVALYTSWRQGKVGRALISDVVDASATSHPMHPTAPTGFDVKQVLQIFESLGLSAAAYFTILNGFTSIPEIPAALLPVKSDVRTIAESLFTLDESQAASEELQREKFIDQHMKDFEKSPIAYADGVYMTLVLSGGAEPAAKVAAVHLIDCIIGIVVKGYINSRIPLYCDGADHAIALCGIAHDDKGTIYYFHDDQYGPYIGSRSFMAISRGSFGYQSYGDAESGEYRYRSVASVDRSSPDKIGEYDGSADEELGIHTVVVPNPPRLLLLPAAALTQSYKIFRDVFVALHEIKDDEQLTASLSPDTLLDFRCSAIMGIDYKSQRLREVGDDKIARRFYAGFHLAEWVVVVEVRQKDTERVQYEFVFDGSSDNDNPLLQMARIKNKILALQPHPRMRVDSLPIQRCEFPPVYVPERIGKVYSEDDNLGRDDDR